MYLGLAGADTYVAGSGSGTILGAAAIGGSTSTADTFYFAASTTGGTAPDVIFGFSSADKITTAGYSAAATTTLVSGALQITLADKTTIFLAGVSSLNSGQLS